MSHWDTYLVARDEPPLWATEQIAEQRERLRGRRPLSAAEAMAAAALVKTRHLRYSDDQPRDDQGRFSGDGGDSSSGSTSGPLPEQLAATEDVAKVNDLATSAFSAPTLSGDQQDAIDRYTTGASSDVNSALRGGELATSSEAEGVVRAMDGVISQSTATQDVTVYRGLSDDVAKGLQVGDTMVDHGFVSTSLRESVAETYMSAGYAAGREAPYEGQSGFENPAIASGEPPTLAQINIPAGASAFVEDTGGAHSSGLSQVVLPHDSSFQIAGKDTASINGVSYDRVTLNYTGVSR